MIFMSLLKSLNWQVKCTVICELLHLLHRQHWCWVCSSLRLPGARANPKSKEEVSEELERTLLM